MATISIVPEQPSTLEPRFRAVSGQRQSSGKTPGEALDAMIAQLNEPVPGSMLVVQQMQPDRFFTHFQQKRLGELMERWREARDSGNTVSAEDQSELDRLIAFELEATVQRAKALLGGSQS